MNIFDEYKSKEDLLRDISAEIIESQTDDGEKVYKLQNRQAETLRAKFDAEVKNAKSQREKKQEAEAKLAEIQAQREKDLVELQQLRELNPADLKTTLEKYVSQTAESTARIKALEKELEPLRAANAEYKAKEIRAKIETELVETARKLNCCETAMRDVRRLAPMFHISESGLVVTKDNKIVADVLAEEIEHSPHWLKRSQGAGSSPGGQLTSEARFREALKGRDFSAVLANAPRSQVR